MNWFLFFEREEMFDEYKDLRLAAMQGNVEEILLCLECGASIKSKDLSSGQTALHVASFGGQKGAVECLLKKGAEKNAQDFFGNTPLHLATIYEHVEVADMLASHGADLNVRNFKKPTVDLYQQNTPLHLAVLKQNEKLVEVLLHHGAQPNMPNALRQTPLHLAMQRVNRRVIELLVLHGGCVDAKDKNGLTPADVAKKQGMNSNIAFLSKLVGCELPVQNFVRVARQAPSQKTQKRARKTRIRE